MAPGRGPPVYQPATAVDDGTCSVPAAVTPRSTSLVWTPMAGIVSATGSGTEATCGLTDDLTDAAGSQLMPSGGAATGFGGTALRPPADLAPWLLLMVAGGLLIAAGAAGLGWPRRRAVVQR